MAPMEGAAAHSLEQGAIRGGGGTPIHGRDESFLQNALARNEIDRAKPWSNFFDGVISTPYACAFGIVFYGGCGGVISDPSPR